MKLNIRGDKITVTKSIKDYIEDKISRLDKYFTNSDTIPTSRFTLRAEERNQDLYTAIDLVIDKLERQIRKNKTRLNDKYKDLEKFEMSFNFEVPVEEIDDIKIVKRKNVEMKPMDEEEAILQMELLNHDFFVFKNIDEECVSVLYQRKDGKLGIINVK